ncbi:MAG: cob(I)yrinic acid a,c-diamide adenosyltransferase [Bacteroidales bacterium]|nr:cob(I)yrinic acid a,c-diamide adenosyltransferase [Bacteroidales bacterium]
MKIYTKKGDDGTTSLIGGNRVAKCSSRVQAYGDADELISYLGVVRAHCTAAKMQEELLEIQKQLMDVSSHLACDGVCEWLKDLQTETWLEFLEDRLDQMTAAMPAKFAFVIPGPPALSAEIHVARTICRRCERSIVAIESKTPSDNECLRYVNRLSDYLFALARTVE